MQIINMVQDHNNNQLFYIHKHLHIHTLIINDTIQNNNKQEEKEEKKEWEEKEKKKKKKKKSNIVIQ